MKKASLLAVFLTVFLDLLGFGLVVPYLPGVARDLGASDFVATLVGAAYSLGQLVFVPIWGGLSDRVGRRPVLVVSVAATIVAMLLLANADRLWIIFAARALGGVATANIAVAQAYIADVTTPSERPKGMAVVGVAIGLGFVLGPAIGGVLSQLGPAARPGALPAYVAAALSSINLLFVLFALPESLSEERRRSAHAAAPALGRGLGPSVVREVLLEPSVGLAVLVNLVVSTSFAGLEQTFRLFNEDGFGMSSRETGYALLVSGVVLIVVQGGLLRRLSGRVTERSLVLAGLAIEASGFAMVAAAPPRRALLFAGMAVLSFGTALVNPSLPAFVSRCGTTANQGKLLGVLGASGSLSRVLGPLFAGALYQLVSPRAPYVSATCGMILAGVLATRMRLPERASLPR